MLYFPKKVLYFAVFFTQNWSTTPAFCFCLSHVIGDMGPGPPTRDLFKLVHLGAPPINTLVPLGKRTVGLLLKGFLVYLLFQITKGIDKHTPVRKGKVTVSPTKRKTSQDTEGTGHFVKVRSHIASTFASHFKALFTRYV